MVLRFSKEKKFKRLLSTTYENKKNNAPGVFINSTEGND